MSASMWSGQSSTVTVSAEPVEVKRALFLRAEAEARISRSDVE
jgi:hypothetical protein